MGTGHHVLVLLSFVLAATSQNIRTTGPVPPLQWIRLKKDGNGAPPPLMYSAMGYDRDTRRLVIFGGETSGGLPHSGTHILSFDTDEWTTWTPATSLSQELTRKPPARSRAGYSFDLPNAYRGGLLVYGGKGDSGPLDDIWEFRFGADFWYKITVATTEHPSPRYGMLSGGDPPSIANDPLTTTSWLAGGRDNDKLFDWSEIWSLEVNGTIAANYQDAMAYWSRISTSGTGNIKPKDGFAGTVIRSRDTADYNLLVFGGCDGTTEGRPECAEADAHFLQAYESGGFKWNSIAACPSARYGAVLAPNYSARFSSQVYMLLGVASDTLYDTTELASKGEIGVLDTEQGVWARVVPSCDPDSGCPVPREGAAVISSRNNLVGNTQDASDIIVFGGRDKDGKILNDVWLLRATNGTIMTSEQTDWGPEYGDGVLQSSPFTNGRGVSIEFLEQCAKRKPSSSDSETPSHTDGGSPAPTDNPITVIPESYDTGLTHKILSGASVAILLPAAVLIRLASPSYTTQGSTSNPTLILLSGIAGIVGWAMGIAALALAFIGIKYLPSTTAVQKRAEEDDQPLHFQTSHSVAGLVLFALTYVLFPIAIGLIVLGYFRKNPRSQRPEPDLKEQGHEIHRAQTATPRLQPPSSSADRLFSRDREPRSSVALEASEQDNNDDGDPVGAGERIRLRKPAFAPSAFLKEKAWLKKWHRPQLQQRVSSETPESTHRQSFPPSAPPTAPGSPTPPESGFVVLNRTRNALGGRAQTPSHFSNVDSSRGRDERENSAWLYLRRNLNYVGDVDYMISRLADKGSPGTQGSGSHPLSEARPGKRRALRYPSPMVIAGRLAIQIILLALVLFCAMSIATKGGEARWGMLGAFVAWVVLFYAAMFWLAWTGRPTGSVLVVIISRLRGQQHEQGEGEEATEMGTTTVFSDVGSGMMSQYGLRPPYRRVGEHDSGSIGRRLEQDDDDDDVEEEMGRRDISIVTVPKRPLFVTNAAADPDL